MFYNIYLPIFSYNFLRDSHGLLIVFCQCNKPRTLSALSYLVILARYNDDYGFPGTHSRSKYLKYS